MNRIELKWDYTEDEINAVIDVLYPDDNAFHYINRFIPEIFKMNRESMLIYLRNNMHNQNIKAGRTNICLVKNKGDNNLIGFAVFGDFISSQPNSFGIVIAEKYSGNGFGNETMNLLINILRENDINIVNGYCQSDNTAINRIMVKNGFIRDNNYNEMPNVNKYTLTIK